VVVARQLGQVIQREPPDGERLVVVHPRLAPEDTAAEAQVHELADVLVGVCDLPSRTHGHQPLDRDADTRLLLHFAHDGGRGLLARIRDAGDQRPLVVVGPLAQQHSALVVEDDGADAREPEQLMADGGPQITDEVRGRHDPDPSRPTQAARP